MAFGRLLLLLLLSLLLLSISTTVHCSFACSSTATCQALVGYVPVNKTTLADIQALFSLDSLASLLGANALPLYTLSTHTISANSAVRVPIPCNCTAGRGVSNHKPIYTVRPDDGLYFIASTVFSKLLEYHEIVRANNIKNENLIQVGQELWIPLPCSCDAVSGADRVAHYAHVVTNGSTVEEIAMEFGSTEPTLLRLNNMKDPKDLKADQVLDVPLRVCSSSISNESLDSSLLVPNNSYALTAHNCVQCSCNSSDWQLKCKPSQGANITNWATCPSMQCDGGSYIGNTARTSCGLTTCAYQGYNEQKILTHNSCPNEEASGSPPPNNSGAGWSGSRKNLKWMWIFISNLGLFSSSLFW